MGGQSMKLTVIVEFIADGTADARTGSMRVAGQYTFGGVRLSNFQPRRDSQVRDFSPGRSHPDRTREPARVVLASLYVVSLQTLYDKVPGLRNVQVYSRVERVAVHVRFNADTELACYKPVIQIVGNVHRRRH